MANWFTEYRASLKMIEVEEVLDLVFYRPLAFVFVKLIYHTQITPNQISFIAVIFGVIAGIMFAYGTAVASLMAAIFLIIYDVLDCSDGMLARLKQNGTLVGRIVDVVSDYVVTVVAYIGIAIGLTIQTENAFYAWSLAIAAGISNAVHSIALDYYRNAFMDNVLERESTLGAGLDKFEEEYHALRQNKTQYLLALLLWFYLKYSAVQIKFTQSKPIRYDGDDYYRKNKRILHLWTYLGPTTELTFMIICGFLHRMDIFLWGIIIIGNLYALFLFLYQARINQTLKVLEAH
jgi:phosphatidylglycerophosphate synthase